MKLIDENIKWIMLVFGAITCTMILAVFSPNLVMNSIFGASINDALAQLIVRSWGSLVAIIGALLIYGAYIGQYRNIILFIAALSKLIFIFLLVIYGKQYLDKTFISIIIDSVAVIFFVIHLVSIKAKNS